jgi:predicted secreted protein
MTWPLGIAIYFIIWWVVLFAVLPWGVRGQHESGEVVPGSEPGAPAVHLVWKKLLWTTLVASIVFGLCYALYQFNLVPIDWLISISNPPHR